MKYFWTLLLEKMEQIRVEAYYSQSGWLQNKRKNVTNEKSR